MKFKTPVTVNVLSPLSLKKSSEFLDAVQTFCEALPHVIPEKWGWWEPLNRNFDPFNLKILIPDGGRSETIYWQHKKSPKAEGSFSVRWNSKSPKVCDTHSAISFSSELGQIPQAELITYLKTASVRSNADFAFIDALTEPYKEFSIESGSAPYGERFMIATHLLRHWLPDVFWGTVFGPAYVRLLGKERLLTAPAYIIEELASEMIYVQLSKKIEDVLNDETAVRRQRELFKGHFPSNMFFISGQGYDRLQRGPIGDVFAVPNFELKAD